MSGYPPQESVYPSYHSVIYPDGTVIHYQIVPVTQTHGPFPVHAGFPNHCYPGYQPPHHDYHTPQAPDQPEGEEQPRYAMRREICREPSPPLKSGNPLWDISKLNPTDLTVELLEALCRLLTPESQHHNCLQEHIRPIKRPTRKLIGDVLLQLFRNIRTAESAKQGFRKEASAKLKVEQGERFDEIAQILNSPACPIFCDLAAERGHDLFMSILSTWWTYSVVVKFKEQYKESLMDERRTT